MRFPGWITSVTTPVLRRLKLRISAGPNAGLYWSRATAGRGYGRGTFEPERIGAIVTLLRPGDCFWDVGAHKGYVTLVAARRVGPAGRVYAFEPLAENRRFLASHVEWNRMTNVEVKRYALADFDGEARFGGSPSSWAGSLGRGVQVAQVRSAGSLVASGECARPSFLKIDAEGAEVRILEGAKPVLTDRVILLVSTHSAELHEACRAFLSDRRCRVLESGGERGYEPDLLAIGVGRGITSREIERLRELGYRDAQR